MLHRTLFHAWFLPVVVAGCMAAPPSANVEQAIVKGVSDSGDADSNVVALTNDGMLLCTGEVISPHVVLSAAHCVIPPQGTGIKAFIGPDINGPGQTIDVIEQTANPAYGGMGAHDEGVFILADAAPVRPLSYNRLAIPTSWQGSHGARIVGYGMIRPSDVTTAGTRRQTGLEIVEVDPNTLIYSNNFSGTCFGDSGGPAITSVAGNDVIISLTSYGYATRLSPCDVKVGDWDARVDPDFAFIDGWVTKYDPPTKQGALGDACDGNLDCTSRVCARPPGATTSVCSDICDPSASGPVCGASMSCQSVDDMTICMPPHGCEMSPSGTSSTPTPFVVALFLLAVRACRSRRRCERRGVAL